MSDKETEDNLNKLRELKSKELERSIELTSKKKQFGITLAFRQWEIDKIRHKTRRLKSNYNIKRSDILRKVLLNLDDEDLIDFLNLRKK